MCPTDCPLHAERPRLRPATPADVPALRRCAREAYARYVPRIGREPAPMNADFASAVAAGRVHVADLGGTPIGYVDLRSDGPVLRLDSVAVSPEHAGRGVGRRLMAFVEERAGACGHEAVELYTNVAMRENLIMYPRLGYAEIGRRREDGFERVYFRKDL